MILPGLFRSGWRVWIWRIDIRDFLYRIANGMTEFAGRWKFVCSFPAFTVSVMSVVAAAYRMHRNTRGDLRWTIKEYGIRLYIFIADGKRCTYRLFGVSNGLTSVFGKALEYPMRSLFHEGKKAIWNSARIDRHVAPRVKILNQIIRGTGRRTWTSRRMKT